MMYYGTFLKLLWIFRILMLSGGQSDDTTTVPPVQYICNGGSSEMVPRQTSEPSILAGPPGKRGPQGEAGLKGNTGSQGIKGDVGPQCQCDFTALEERNEQLTTAVTEINQKLLLLMCPPLSTADDDNLMVDIEGPSLLGSVASYRCKNGFERIGDATSRCQTNGVTTQWSGNQPKCKACTTRNGNLLESQLIASSIHNVCNRKELWKLNAAACCGKGGAWCSANNNLGNVNPYIGATFDTDTVIKGVITQGRHDDNQWVTSFKVGYTDEQSTLKYVLDRSGDEKIFNGNTDRNTLVDNFFPNTVVTRELRIYPLSYSGHTSMRFNVILCE